MYESESNYLTSCLLTLTCCDLLQTMLDLITRLCVCVCVYVCVRVCMRTGTYMRV